MNIAEFYTELNRHNIKTNINKSKLEINRSICKYIFNYFQTTSLAVCQKLLHSFAKQMIRKHKKSTSEIKRVAHVFLTSYVSFHLGLNIFVYS